MAFEESGSSSERGSGARTGGADSESGEGSRRSPVSPPFGRGVNPHARVSNRRHRRRAAASGMGYIRNTRSCSEEFLPGHFQLPSPSCPKEFCLVLLHHVSHFAAHVSCRQLAPLHVEQRSVCFISWGRTPGKYQPVSVSYSLYALIIGCAPSSLVTERANPAADVQCGPRRSTPHCG